MVGSLTAMRKMVESWNIGIKKCMLLLYAENNPFSQHTRRFNSLPIDSDPLGKMQEFYG